MSTLHTNVCSRYLLDALHWVWGLSKFDKRETTEIPQQCVLCRFKVLVNFGQVSLFVGAFIVDLEYYLFIVNFIKCYFMAYFF